MKIKESDLKSVLEAIEADLNSAFESQKANLLAKADVSKQPEPEASASEGAGDAVASPPEAAADTSSPASSPSPESAPASDGPPAPAGDASAAPAPAPGAGDPGADQQLSPEALQAEYAQLPPEELDMHLQAAMAAKEAMMGQGAGGQAPQGSAAPMSPPASPSMPPMAMKAEIKPDAKAQGGQITQKSEADPEIESLKSLIKSQSEDIEILTKAVKSALERPERKAVTTVAALLKSEPEPKTYTSLEAKAKLNGLIPSLNKAERELVMDFYLGKVSVDKLTPILEKK